MGDAENHRELTLILYLNGPPDGAAGGELRCYGVDGEHVDVAPAPGPVSVG